MQTFPMQDGPFKPSFDSLYQFKCPAWFQDAKFGIWSHWGPQSVPMYGDWYARNMYIQGSEQYLYHLRHYGHPSQFGYKDLVQLWKAECFHPEDLMDLYKKAGAKYFMAQAMHHDNFFNYNSGHHPFNSVQMGPHMDIVAMWKQAAENHGLHFGLSEHHGASYSWMDTSKLCDTTGPYAGIPYDGRDPAYTDYYHDSPVPDLSIPRLHYSHDPRWPGRWYQDIKEVVDLYQPEMLYSDGAVPFFKKAALPQDDTYLAGAHMVAHLYNQSIKAHGENQAIYLQKDSRPEFYNIGLLDLERSTQDVIRPEPWQTDTCLGHWFYDVRAKYKSARQVIEILVDNVSKNGNLLLNIPQLPDGSIDAECRYILEEMARWFPVCGEGIFGTRPFSVYGEGPTNATQMIRDQELVYTPYDIRYTVKGDTLYAFLMNPGSTVSLLSLGGQTVNRVELLGLGEIPFTYEFGVLTVALPGKLPAQYLNCLRIV